MDFKQVGYCLSSTTDDMCCAKSYQNTISVYIFQYLCSTFVDNRSSVDLAEHSYMLCEGGLKEKVEYLFTHWMTPVGFESSLQLDKLRSFHLQKYLMCHPITKDGRIHMEGNRSNKSSAITFATPRQKGSTSCEKENTIFLLLI